MSRTDPAQFPAVLIVEDDPTIGQHLHLGLQEPRLPHHLVAHRRSRPHPRHRIQTRNRSLDLDLPDLDGVELRITSLRRDAFVAVTAMVWRLQSRG